jgi:hypothetical protein
MALKLHIHQQKYLCEIKHIFTVRGVQMNIDTIKEKILCIIDCYPIKKVELFGSRANGTNMEDSDVDLIMEFYAPISLMTLSKIKCDLEELLGVGVDIIHGPLLETDMIETDKVVELYAA